MEFRHITFLLWSLLLVLMGRFYTTDAASIAPAESSPRYVNRTKSVTLKYRYTLASNEAIQLLSCGYAGPSNTRKTMVVKRPGKVGEVDERAADFPAQFRGRVEVFEEGQIFGMTISNVNNLDQKDFDCNIVVSIDGNVQVPVTSAVLKLSIRDPPEFTNCLGTSDFTVVEDHSMNVSCFVYGNPVPRLTCYVVRDDNVRGRPLGGVNQNITLVTVTNIKRNIASVQCFADGDEAGRNMRTRRVIVLHKPTAPRNLKRTASSSSTIDLSWEAPEKDGGRPLIRYEVQYGENINSLQSKNVSANSLDTQLTGLLARRTYIVILRARNSLGLGDENRKSFQTVDFTGDMDKKDDSDTTTIAIVVPIVVVVVLIIAVAVGCYFKKKKSEPKNLPVSYVEEAVGYPASGKGLYANVDKSTKKPLTQDDESTSGYPDILHQTKERPVEANMNEVEYTPSAPTLQYTAMKRNGSAGDYPPDDEEMSPSYENSRKEYV